MYTLHKNKCEVMLYAYVDLQGEGSESSGTVHSQSRKRPKQMSSRETPSPKRDAYVKTITQVEAIMADLKAKHGSKYDAAKYASWALSINSGKHSSTDEPPDFPFFTGRKKSSGESHPDGPGSSSGSSSGSRSPTKRLGHRTECINQLSKWHGLLQDGAIFQEQYEEMKGTIMEDNKIKRFKNANT